MVLYLTPRRHHRTSPPKFLDDGVLSKHTARALWKGLLFVAIVGCTIAYNVIFGDSDDEEFYLGDRRLAIPCSDLRKADRAWHAVLMGFGVLYMFLALAIVCDEFFVPALEEMSGPRRLDLSMDVAGATLMAAGGSAPELFSSFFGTFNKSEIGFGTIIGSATFNVLFVIAMCAIFSKEVLTLTWWPLFRDTLYYSFGIVVLCVFVGINSAGTIEWWEALVLFALYIGYVVIMWQNANLYHMITGKEWVDPEEAMEKEAVAPEVRIEQAKHASEEDEEALSFEVTPSHYEITTEDEIPELKPKREPLSRKSSSRSFKSAASLDSLHRLVFTQTHFDFRWQGTFRAGVLKLLRSPSGWAETGGLGIVAKIDGDADQVFRSIDTNGDGKIDKEELKRLFDVLGHIVDDHELDDVFNMLDVDETGVISQAEFRRWYTNSEELLRSQVRLVFDSLDTDKSGTIDKQELMALLIQLDPHITDEDVDAAIDEMYQEGSREEITFSEFEEWYENSISFERQKQKVEEDAGGAWESLKPPVGESCFSWLQYIIVFPLVFCMAVTIPDVRIPGRGKWCYISFLLSIAWIGGFSYFMVQWAEIIGNTLGIPTVIMGLTILAAGTSVPDLLSSVIVARRGSGDMAVSSSIGSNIFDILVGLPVPWLLFTAWPTTDRFVTIGTDNIFVYLLILLAMLLFVLISVHLQGWKLTKMLGGMMILGYAAFLVVAVLLELPFQTCIE